MQDSGLTLIELAKKTKSADLRSLSEHMLRPGQLEASALQPHEAYEKLLSEWVPFLNDEIKTCVDFLMLREDPLPSNAPQSSVLSLAGTLLLRPQVHLVKSRSLLIPLSHSLH